MKKSSVIYNFAISQQQGKILLTAQEYPWSVLQVVTFEPQYFDKFVELCKRRGMVAPMTRTAPSASSIWAVATRAANIQISISILIRQQPSTSIWRH